MLIDSLPPLLRGAGITLCLTGGASLLAVSLALVAGLSRLSRFLLLRVVSLSYIELFRGTSGLVQLYWFYFGLPLLGINLSAVSAGILVLGLNCGAYGAEVVRATILAVPIGQREAATALSLSSFHQMRYIILPQAVVMMLPSWGNLIIELLKNTALVSLITISELTFEAQILRAETLRSPEIFGIVLVFYFVMALGVTALFRLLERHFSRGSDPGRHQ